MTIAAKFLEVQNELNVKLHPEWRTQGWAYPDAMFTEATEAYNHLNWEWWRATGRTIDWDQVKLEIVDVAHFMFSEIIIQGDEQGFAECVEEFEQDVKDFEVKSKLAELDAVKSNIKEFILAVLRYDGRIFTKDLNDVISWFLITVDSLGLTMEQFYVLFIGKVCLNQLRWKNGYKKGIFNVEEMFGSKEFYIKTWDGVEDNVWLANHAVTLDVNAADFKDKLFADLEAKYKEVYSKVWNSQAE